MLILDAEIRAERARQILADELVQEAFAKVEASAIDGLAEVDLADLDTMRRCAAALQAARAVRQHLTSVIQTGEMAARPRPKVA